MNRTVIVAAADVTSVTDEVLSTSISLARSMPGAELHVVHVIEFVPPPDAAVLSTPADIVDTGRAFLDRTTKEASARFDGRVVGHLAVGKAAKEILQLAQDLEADIIVVGSHSKKMVERFLMGSVSEQVVRKAHCPVLVARPKEYASGVPEIEPPCPDCVATRKETNGETLWCQRHAKRISIHPRLHYESPPLFGVGSMLIRPEE